ncbi:hypothetical protein ES965_04595 [Bacillus subtilis]|nr:hypothetical protein ES965_04595 [Bacillus subtilis]
MGIQDLFPSARGSAANLSIARKRIKRNRRLIISLFLFAAHLHEFLKKKSLNSLEKSFKMKLVVF